MLMGTLVIISGCFLYWMLKPPLSHNFIFQEEVVFPKKKPTLKGEAWRDG